MKKTRSCSVRCRRRAGRFDDRGPGRRERGRRDRRAQPQSAGAAKLTWKKCGTEDYPTLQCASLKVPLDHANPHGKQITLALSRVPHTSKTYQGPLLVNPGGPGGSGLTLAGFVASSLPKEVAAQYDVIGFDPRGVGASKPALDCRPGYFDAGAPRLRAAARPRSRRPTSTARAGLRRGLRQEVRGRAAVHRHGERRPGHGRDPRRPSARRRSTTSATRTAPTWAPSTPSSTRSGYGAWCWTPIVDPDRRLVRGQPRPGLRLRRPPQGVHGLGRQVQRDVQARHRSGEDRGQVVRDAGGPGARSPRAARWAPPSWRTPSSRAATTTATGRTSPRRSRRT